MLTFKKWLECRERHKLSEAARHKDAPGQLSLWDFERPEEQPEAPQGVPDLAVIKDLAAKSIPREVLRRDYRSLAKSSDLFHVGYIVSHWVKPGVAESEVLEYMPRKSELPRLTIDNYDDQRRLHLALGIAVADKGQPYVDPNKVATKKEAGRKKRRSPLEPQS